MLSIPLRINGKFSAFSEIVKDALVDEGAQAMRNGDRLGFAWNGIKYAFYQTFMPNSVQEGVIDAVGGPVIGKTVGWLGKAASHLPKLWHGIGELAGGLAFKAHWFDRKSSKVLGQALEEAGFKRGINEEAHHIVLAGRLKEDAAAARAILRRFGIGINEAGNGVFLPKGIHRPLHTPGYDRAIIHELEFARSRDEVLEILERIRARLIAGKFP